MNTIIAKILALTVAYAVAHSPFHHTPPAKAKPAAHAVKHKPHRHGRDYVPRYDDDVEDDDACDDDDRADDTDDECDYEQP